MSSVTDNNTWTIGRLLTWTSEFLQKHGSPSPRLDAEVLLAHVRGCKRIELYTAFDQPATDEVKAAYREMVRRRSDGTPVAYLVGEKEFFSMPFYVNGDCLVPRPETEHLVTAALDEAKTLAAGRDEPLHIIDVGTGSGCIAVAIAKHFPKCRVTAIDIEPATLEIATRNRDKHSVSERVEMQQGDLLNDMPAQSADMVVSNPPYVSEDEYQALDKSVRQHEPRRALLSGPTGMEIIEQLINQAASVLRPGGVLLIEGSPMIADAMLAAVADTATWQAPQMLKDLAGHRRLLQVRRV